MPYGAAAISCACVARRSGYSGASAPSNACHACLACPVRPVSVCAGRSRSRALLPVAEQSRWHRHLPTDPSRTWLGAAQWPTVSRPQLHSAGRSRGTPWRSAWFSPATGPLSRIWPPARGPMTGIKPASRCVARVGSTGQITSVWFRELAVETAPTNRRLDVVICRYKTSPPSMLRGSG